MDSGGVDRLPRRWPGAGMTCTPCSAVKDFRLQLLSGRLFFDAREGFGTLEENAQAEF